MKLLSPKEATSLKKKENEKVLDESVRLQKIHRALTAKLAGAKNNYDPEKAAALKDFEEFCRDMDQKRSKKLQELQAVNEAIGQKKDIYYGLIEKSDLLLEREAALNERERKLDSREAFINQIEQKKWTTTATTSQ